MAQAMISAVERGQSGERYIISNQFQTMSQITSKLEKASGVPAPKINLPYPMALLIGWVSQTVAGLQGKDALITVNGIRTLKYGADVSSAKAIRELGHTPRPFEETLRDAVNWYRVNQPEKLVKARA